MNEIDPRLRYTPETVRAYQTGDELVIKEGQLNSLAARIADEYRRDTISPSMVSGLLRVGEFLALAAISVLIMLVYVGVPQGMLLDYPAAIITGSALYVIFAEVADAYQIRAIRNTMAFFPRVAATWTAAFAVMALTAFFMKTSEDFSRVWFGSWFLAGLVLLFGVRLTLNWLVRKWARNGTMERRAVIVGGGKAAEKLIRAMEAQPDNDVRICGIFDDRDDERSPLIVAGYPKLGNIEELVEFTRRARISMLIVSLPLDAEKRVLHMLKKLWVLPVDIRLSAHSHKLRFRPRTYSFIGKVPMFDIFDRPIRDWDRVAKRGFDIVFSLLGIIVLSPIMLATAIAVRLTSKGPVIFVQKRHGFNNEIINVYKFRSMYVDQQDATARNAVTRNDPRVTPVGRFIRKTSIDELPQFFNALKGDLSLVGPRPHAVHAQTRDKLYGEVVDGYFARHRVKPGVTGWAQINGWRGEVDTDEKIKKRTEYDLYYIENWSLLLDLKILFLTPVSLLNTENAY
ncbi:MAG: undecaprenyl-phosphate glucose phosphotransferase [Roseitalea porphyridii]|jgi:Undecaprenyl-phosphate glucose phosphotransferase|uniref:undecaprenyl-phosphate glucose phosphotransferase n=1 Tax=Roseitalea porphyridii TaxID=1852022 RepID=UPI0032EB0914